MLSGDSALAVDWTKDETYDYTVKLADRGWAWEWLRRNPAFRTAWNDARLHYGIAGYDGATTLLVSQSDTPRLLEWDCLYCSSPQEDARLASVFWSPEICSSVLKLHAFPLKAQVEATPFLLRDLACPSALLELPNRAQHLLFHDGSRSLQLVVEGEDVLRPVRLLTDGAPGKALAGRQLRSLLCFNDLRLSGRLYDSHFQRELPSQRLRLVLRILDGSLAGASHREIAQIVFADEFSTERWYAPGRPLRDRVRRAIYRGHQLMHNGYRDLLS
jgi:hypothetical protein